MSEVNNVADNQAERAGQLLKVPLLIATLAIIPTFVLEAAVSTEPWRTIAIVANWAIWIVFLIEMVVMLVLVDKRLAWIKNNPLDVAIVLLTAPVLTNALQAIRLLRLLRLVRLLRVAQLARNVFSLAGVKYVTLLAVLTIIAGGEAFSEVEKVQITDSFYWAISTMTTVGYGDITPHTETGQLIAVTLMIVGVSFVAVLTGAIAERFVASQDTPEIGASTTQLENHLLRVSERLDRIETELRELSPR